MPAQRKRAPPQRPRWRVCLSPFFFARQPVRGARCGAGGACGRTVRYGAGQARAALPCGSRTAAWGWSRRLLRPVCRRREVGHGGRPRVFSGSGHLSKAWVFGERPEALAKRGRYSARAEPFLTSPQGWQEVRVKGATPPCGGRGGKAPCLSRAVA